MKILTLTLLLLHILTSPGQILTPEIDEPYFLREEIPILMYHEIGTPEGPWKELYVEPETFAQQLDWLQENNYTTISLKDLYEHWYQEKPLPEKPIVLTFDDGYRNMYLQALPLLSEREMVATFFVYPAKFNTPGGLTNEMVIFLAEKGMEIGSHTLNHNDLTKISAEALKKELVESKLILEELIQKPVNFLCYPAGRFNENIIEKTKNAGYLGATTTQFGNASPKQDPFQWKRVRINYSDGIKGLARKLEQ